MQWNDWNSFNQSLICAFRSEFILVRIRSRFGNVVRFRLLLQFGSMADIGNTLPSFIAVFETEFGRAHFFLQRKLIGPVRWECSLSRSVITVRPQGAPHSTQV